jgi:hypothetical protein
MNEPGAFGQGSAVRNSVSLGVFLPVAADARVPCTVAELASHGVTASAAATRAEPSGVGLPTGTGPPGS